MEVMNAVHQVEEHNRRFREVVLIVTLNVRDASKFVIRKGIAHRNIKSSCRAISYGCCEIIWEAVSLFMRLDEDGDHVLVSMRIHPGAGGLEHFLRYLLRLDMREDPHLVGFENNWLSKWVTPHGFSLPLKRIEVVTRTKNGISLMHRISTGELIIESKSTFRKLGLMLDFKINFFEPIKATPQNIPAAVSA